MVHKVLTLAALCLAGGIAGATVDVQLRVRMKEYELARARESLVEGGERLDVVRARVLARWSPERIHRAAGELRARRRAAAGDPGAQL